MPGTSRSGITITAALMLGLSRQSAARFSFLLAIPAIGGASALELWELSGSVQSVDWISIAVGLIVAAVSAYFCIKFFLAAIQRIGMLPFMIYRLILATVIVLSMV
jgi:undecaprenyl-diphosphatase